MPGERWLWGPNGPRLFDAAGREYKRVGELDREEVERLLTLGELDAVRIECGAGVEEWVKPADARRVWVEVQIDFLDVDPWRPPPGAAGARQFEAQLWRADNGDHALVFTNE